MGLKAGYARLSKDDDMKRYGSIIEQKNMIENYYRKNLDYHGEIIFFEDDDESGFEFDRPGLLKLEAEVYNGNIDTLILKDLSRLGRKGWKTEEIYEKFVDDNGVRIIAINDNHDSEDPVSREIMGIHTWSNERYVRDISRKILSHFKQRQERGDLIITVPYGYKKDGDKIAIDEIPAGIVRDIFELYLNGYGYRRISVIMEEKGYLTPSCYKNRTDAAKVWSFQVVKNILTNPFYAGDLIQRKTFKKKVKGKSFRTPKDELLIFKDHHQPIIPRETFDLAQKIIRDRDTRKTRGSKENSLHLFAGKIICDKCGKTYIYRLVKGKRGFYYCGTQFKYGIRSCKNGSIAEDKLLDDIKSMMAKLIEENENILTSLKDRLVKEVDSPKYEAVINKLNVEIEKKERHIQKVYVDKLSGENNIPDNVYDSILQQLSEELDKYKRQLQQYKDIKYNAENQRGILEDRNEKLRMFLNKELTRKDIEILIDKVTIDDSRENMVRIYWNI